ncbi:hypothetical protein Mapa_000155 [Marchantia paleacea]|nr:hypothetical protein Mapa_000155 [Marchantia paleacea]
MDAQLVNWGVLDALVLDYAEEEQLVECEGFEASPQVGPRRLIDLVRALIETGRIAEALAVINQSAQALLEDPHLLFRLQKQRFLELLRGGEPNQQQQAILCSRTTLGPCALNAYPEAYEEFKRVLLALMYDKDDPSSPVADEWSEVRRAELAAIVASTLKAQQHAYDPLFSLTLRYLISVQNAYCQQQAMVSPVAEIAASLLSKDRDPPAAPRESLLEAPNFSEADVQALAQAVDLPRQGAVNSLRYTGGDLTSAFKNELSRMRLSTSLVDEIVREYCLYRGLIERGTNSPSDSRSSSDAVAAELTSVLALDVVNRMKSCTEVKVSPSDQSEDTVISEVKEDLVGNWVASSENGERHVEMDEATFMVEPSVKNKFQLNATDSIPDNSQSSEVAEDVVMQDCDDDTGCDQFVDCPQNGEMLREDGRFGSCGGCSTSGLSQSGSNGAHSAGLRMGIGKENPGVPSTGRRRWRGRKQLILSGLKNGSWVTSAEAKYQQLSSLELSQLTNLAESQDMKTDTSNKPESQDVVVETYGRALGIRQLAIEGKIDAVIQEVQRLHPDFFEHNQHLLFQLKQVEFLQLVEGGHFTDALRVARADLGPLAAKYHELLKPLKETLLALARPKGEIPLKPTPPSVLAAALQVALGASLGIAEPKLMKIMRNCLYMHTEWFKLQMCSDPFGELLSINTLKETNSNASASTRGDSKLGSGGGSGDHAVIDLSSTRSGDGGGSQQSESSREGPLFDEMSILTIMEWMALSRGDAIQLLTQYDGSVDSVLANLI